MRLCKKQVDRPYGITKILVLWGQCIRFVMLIKRGRGVFYIAPQAALLDELMDKRPEADPLNDTVYVDQDSLHRIIPRYILS